MHDIKLIYNSNSTKGNFEQIKLVSIVYCLETPFIGLFNKYILTILAPLQTASAEMRTSAPASTILSARESAL